MPTNPSVVLSVPKSMLPGRVFAPTSRLNLEARSSTPFSVYPLCVYLRASRVTNLPRSALSTYRGVVVDSPRGLPRHGPARLILPHDYRVEEYPLRVHIQV